MTSFYGSPQGTDLWASEAVRVMRALNPNALVAEENGIAIFIEEHWDGPDDRRLFKLEYQSTVDAKHAIAICRANPWSYKSSPNAGIHVTRGHCFQSGLLCLNSNHATSARQSSMDLDTVVKRARYWCTAFSVLKETGKFPRV
jgi:hypothetical protein